MHGTVRVAFFHGGPVHGVGRSLLPPATLSSMRSSTWPGCQTRQTRARKVDGGETGADWVGQRIEGLIGADAAVARRTSGCSA